MSDELDNGYSIDDDGSISLPVKDDSRTQESESFETVKEAKPDLFSGTGGFDLDSDTQASPVWKESNKKEEYGRKVQKRIDALTYKAASERQALTTELASVRNELATLKNDLERGKLESAFVSIASRQKEALDEGNNEEFLRLDAEKEVVRSRFNSGLLNQRAANAPNQQQTVNDSQAAYDTFLMNNDWYGENGDDEMTDYANAQIFRLQKDPRLAGQPAALILREVQSRIVKKFPERFERGSGKPAASALGPGGRAKPTTIKLTQAERDVADRLLSKLPPAERYAAYAKSKDPKESK